MPIDYDVIVVGSGAGGASLAYACTRAGKRVLLVERGREQVIDEPVHNERATLIEKKPYDDRAIEVNGACKRLYMGGLLGGGTALFGGALLRPSRDDFHPGKYYGNRIPRAIWNWPISYDDLAPFYAEAEQLFGVAGAADEKLAPLEQPERGYPRAPLPLHPINRNLIAANRAGGLSPFQLPLAIDPARCLRCEACAGYLCPTGARSSSAQLVERARSNPGAPGLTLVTYTEVERLLTGPVIGACLVDRATGERRLVRAVRIVLAAGAIGSPLLLLRSGMAGPLVGRNYMMHLSPVVIGIFSYQTKADTSFVKQVGFADYYFGCPGYRAKIGLVQSLPVPGPLLLQKMAPLLPRRARTFLRSHMLPLAGIVEDLPNYDNQISWGCDGQPALRHRFGAFDIARGRRLARLMASILKRAGAVVCVTKRFASDEHVAHQCGTLRFGKSPEHAVLDSDCRMFDHPNVFVVDGSFMPTSLGVGPALTIIANALRVAKVVSRES